MWDKNSQTMKARIKKSPNLYIYSIYSLNIGYHSLSLSKNIIWVRTCHIFIEMLCHNYIISGLVYQTYRDMAAVERYSIVSNIHCPNNNDQINITSLISLSLSHSSTYITTTHVQPEQLIPIY